MSLVALGSFALGACAPAVAPSTVREPVAITRPLNGQSFWQSERIRVEVRVTGSKPAVIEDGSRGVPLEGGRGSVSYEEPGRVVLRAHAGEDVSDPTRILIKSLEDVCDPSALVSSPSRHYLERVLSDEAASFSAPGFSYVETFLPSNEYRRAASWATALLERIDERALAMISQVRVVHQIESNRGLAAYAWDPSQRSVTVAYTPDRESFGEALLTGVGAVLSLGPFAGEYSRGFQTEGFVSWNELHPSGFSYGHGGGDLAIDEWTIENYGILTPRGITSFSHDIGSTFAHLVLNPDRVFHYAEGNAIVARKVELLTSAFSSAFGMGEAYFRCIKRER